MISTVMGRTDPQKFMTENEKFPKSAMIHSSEAHDFYAYSCSVSRLIHLVQLKTGNSILLTCIIKRKIISIC